MTQRTIRFDEATLGLIRLAARKRRLTATVVIRQAVEQSLRSGNEAEERVSSTLAQIRDDLSRIYKVQQTLFAFVDALAKAVLTGLPEQSASSIARGNERYDRFVRSASASILNKSNASMFDGSESWPTRE
jgi:hypothetical protein